MTLKSEISFPKSLVFLKWYSLIVSDRVSISLKWDSDKITINKMKSFYESENPTILIKCINYILSTLFSNIQK